MKFRSTYPALKFGPVIVPVEGSDKPEHRYVDFVPVSDDAGEYETTDAAEVAALKAAAEHVDYITTAKRGE